MRLMAFSTMFLTMTLMAQQLSKPMPPVPQVQGVPPAARKTMQSISPERISAEVRFLASDMLEGRGPGQRGGQIAAEYIATQFALMGLEPAGENGTYLQKVPMVNVSVRPESTFAFVNDGATEPLRGGQDFVATTPSQDREVAVDAPIVFVGYGIRAPEYHWDDYQGVDVKGKVVLMFANEPPSPAPSTDDNFFKGKALTYYGRWTYKYEEAARQGAVAAILIHRTDMASYPWTVVSRGWGGTDAFLRDRQGPRLKLSSWITYEAGTKLLSASGLTIDAVLEQMRKPGFHAIPLKSRLKAHLVSSVEPFEGQNVVARKSGTGAHRYEAVLYTAHYDHFGIKPGQQGDNIYNGAIDNATGCAMLLEVARAYAGSPAPGRSILFAAVDAEEQGLLGSQYFAEHPPIAARDIVLNLNFEGLFIMPVGVPEELLVSGAERTSFYPEVRKLASSFGMTIKPDPFPASGYYYRSDHFSLARVGVPAFSIGAGNKFAGHDESWGEAQAKDFVEKRYHQPTDEYQPSMDFRANARLTQLSFALGWLTAERNQRIEWNPGDESIP